MSFCLHLMMRMNSYRTEHYAKNQYLDEFLGKNCVPLPTRARARNFLEAAWDRFGAHNEVAL
jgi:hypothetical protein